MDTLKDFGTDISGRDINYVIMDYLINEGYPSAAAKFAKEANIQPSVDSDAIQQRVDIRNAIHAGDVQLAIERINELNPQVCALRSPSLFAEIIHVSCTTHKPSGIIVDKNSLLQSSV